LTVLENNILLNILIGYAIKRSKSHLALKVFDYG